MMSSSVVAQSDQDQELLEMADSSWSNFQIAGHRQVNVLGLAPRDMLQNIPGMNWPSPPMQINHVTYCYIDATESDAIQLLANKIDATFQDLAVRVDGGRYARAVYHGKDQHVCLNGPTPCCLVIEDVLEGRHQGTRWLHLVYLSQQVEVTPKPKNEVKHDKTENAGGGSAMGFPLKKE
jgi:hypothetical protein